MDKHRACVSAVIFLARFCVSTLIALLQKSLPELVSAYATAFLVFFVYFCSIHAGAAAAPTHSRRLVAWVLTLLVFVGVMALIIIGWPQIEGHDKVLLIISSLLSILGCISAVTQFAKTADMP